MSKSMTVHVMYSADRNNVIGRKGPHPLLWNHPEDLQMFKETTMGHALVMGRHTYESLPGILPGRAHYVVSRTLVVDDPRVTVVASLDEAIRQCRILGYEKLFIIGGADLINEGMWIADVIHKTIVPTEAVIEEPAMVNTIPDDFVFDGVRVVETGGEGKTLSFSRWVRREISVQEERVAAQAEIDYCTQVIDAIEAAETQLRKSLHSKHPIYLSQSIRSGLDELKIRRSGMSAKLKRLEAIGR